MVYTKFESISRQEAGCAKRCCLWELSPPSQRRTLAEAKSAARVDVRILALAESILEEVVPTSFKVKLFKCFLDAAVSEQIARMVAMKAATENAGEMIKQLSMTYNRARQSQITGEIMEIIGGVEALKKVSAILAVSAKNVPAHPTEQKHRYSTIEEVETMATATQNSWTDHSGHRLHV